MPAGATFLFGSDELIVFELASATTWKQAAAPSQDDFDRFCAVMGDDHHIAAADLRGRRWVFACVYGHADIERFRVVLLPQFKFFSIAKMQGDIVVAVGERTSKWVGMPSVVAAFPAVKFYMVCDAGGHKAVRLERIAAWSAAAAEMSGTLFVQHLTGADVRQIAREWEDVPMKEVHCMIAAARVKDKKLRTPREHVIACAHVQLVAAAKSSGMDEHGLLRSAVCNDIIPFEAFQNLGHAPCVSFEMGSGRLFSMSLHEWLLESKYRRFSLILHGGPELGKTPLALCLCASIAQAEQGGDCPQYILTSSLDSLRDLPASARRKGFPVCMDELCPAAPKGSRPASSLEECKHMLDVRNSVCLHARFKNVSLAKGQYRVVTTNAENPSEFHPSLPADVFEMSDQARAALPSSVRACFKRALFCHITRPMVPPALAASFDERDCAEGAAKIARVLARSSASDGRSMTA